MGYGLDMALRLVDDTNERNMQAWSGMINAEFLLRLSWHDVQWATEWACTWPRCAPREPENG